MIEDYFIISIYFIYVSHITHRGIRNCMVYYVLSELILVITFEIKDSFCNCSARKIKTTWQNAANKKRQYSL